MAHEIVLTGDVGWEITAKDIRASLDESGGDDILFLVNSPGGFVFEAFEIFNLIRDHKAPTEARITGIAASAASYFILAADKVTAHENATFMIHNALAIAIGNHHDMRKTADIIESLSNIIAKEYVNQTGKAINNIKQLMDDATWLFGDEIKDEGFVDEMVDSGSDDGDGNKASAVLTARAAVEICLEKMRTSDAANEDYQKAVAYMDSLALLDGPKAVAVTPSEGDAEKLAAMKNILNTQSTPAVAGQQTQEDKQLKTLAELFTENPSAKAEHDVLIAKARTEGATVAKDEMKAVVDRISPKLMSAEYGADVKEAGIKAIIGTGAESTFETLVIMTDRDIEKAKAEAAKKETEEAGETTGAINGKDSEAQATFQEKLKRTKEGG